MTREEAMELELVEMYEDMDDICTFLHEHGEGNWCRQCCGDKTSVDRLCVRNYIDTKYRKPKEKALTIMDIVDLKREDLNTVYYGIPVGVKMSRDELLVYDIEIEHVPEAFDGFDTAYPAALALKVKEE